MSPRAHPSGDVLRINALTSIDVRTPMPSRHASRTLRAFLAGATIGLALVLFVGAALAEPAAGAASVAASVVRHDAAAQD
jgi:hypothetical protein